MQIIVLANQKGGCGKSTTAVNLAAGLALEGFRVVLVDLDPQCNATTSFEIDPEQLRQQGRFTVLDAYLGSKAATLIDCPIQNRFDGRLSVLPGHRSLDLVQSKLEADLKSRVLHDDQSPLDEDDIRNEHRMRLKRSLSSLDGQVDFVVIDTPPQLGFLLTTALLAADWYLIPVFPSRYDLDGLTKLTQTVHKVRQRANPRLRLLGVVLGNFNTTTTLHKDVREKLASTFKGSMCQTTIHATIRHGEATFQRRTIYEHAPGHASAQQFQDLTREVLQKVQAVEVLPVHTLTPQPPPDDVADLADSHLLELPEVENV